jgi:hypothetical protein
LIIFDKGFVPHIWLIGTIKPIYKNKGDIYEPKNYRPITIVSCLGKLFTSILHLKTMKKEKGTGFPLV